MVGYNKCLVGSEVSVQQKVVAGLKIGLGTVVPTKCSTWAICGVGESLKLVLWQLQASNHIPKAVAAGVTR